eukprot:351402-Chlamydomonas_euryale.AAC.2
MEAAAGPPPRGRPTPGWEKLHARFVLTRRAPTLCVLPAGPTARSGRSAARRKGRRRQRGAADVRAQGVDDWSGVGAEGGIGLARTIAALEHRIAHSDSALGQRIGYLPARFVHRCIYLVHPSIRSSIHPPLCIHVYEHLSIRSSIQGIPSLLMHCSTKNFSYTALQEHLLMHCSVLLCAKMTKRQKWINATMAWINAKMTWMNAKRRGRRET